MSDTSSLIFSFLIHLGLFAVASVFAAMPRPADVGQGLTIELIQAPKAKGLQKIKPKALKSDRIIVSQPVIVTKTQAAKKAPKKIVKKPKVKIKAKEAKNIIVQKEEAFKKINIDPEMSQRRPRPEPMKPVKALPIAKTKPNVKAIDTIVAPPTNDSPSAFPAAPVIGENSASLIDTLGSKDGVKDARNLEQIPGNIPPQYPTADRLNSREGVVILLAYVNDEGVVEKVEVESSTGSLLMNDVSLEAFARYKFTQGQPGWVRMPYEFQLSGPAQEVAGWEDRAKNAPSQ